MPEPLPILFTIPNFITAGSGRVMLNIIQRLNRARFSPVVCVLKKGGNLDREVERMEIPLLENSFMIPAKPYSTLFSRAWKTARIFKPYGFKLWHSFHYTDDYTEPLIARLAGVKHWIYTKKAMGWGSRGWLLRSYLASRIVVDNSDMLHLMFDRIGLRHKVREIHHGILLDQFKPQSAQFKFRKEKNIPEGAVLAGCVAHLVPVKGHPTLLKAISKIPNAHLFLAGRCDDKQYFEKLEKLIAELQIEERVHFLGDVKDIPAFLAEMDLFVLPTWAKWRQEGCPVALLEAMACGKACIATDIPGSRDIIENRKNGILVPPENVDALAQAMKEMTESFSLRQQLGEAARIRIEENFSIEHEVKAHEALYSELLSS